MMLGWVGGAMGGWCHWLVLVAYLGSRTNQRLEGLVRGAQLNCQIVDPLLDGFNINISIMK